MRGSKQMWDGTVVFVLWLPSDCTLFSHLLSSVAQMLTQLFRYSGVTKMGVPKATPVPIADHYHSHYPA